MKYINLIKQSPLSEKKKEALLDLYKSSEIKEKDLEEKFVRGSGSGGQKRNKTSNTVQLKHIPTDIVVKYGKNRERSLNRVLALRELLTKLLK